MDKSYSNPTIQPIYFWVLLLTSFHSFAFGFFKDTDTKEVGRKVGGYLSFHSPPNLSFATKSPQADRMNLLLLTSPVAPAGEIIPSDSNASVQADFPIIDYDDAESNSSNPYKIPESKAIASPMMEEPALLPPADPFVSSDEMNLGIINTTDELMKLYEEDYNTPNLRGTGGFQFLPPYTVERGNMIMNSKAKYTRKARK